MCTLAKLLQSCLSLCNPTDKSPPRSSVYEILQARILEWVAVSSSRRSFRPRDRIPISRLLHRHVGSATWEAPPGAVPDIK